MLRLSTAAVRVSRLLVCGAAGLLAVAGSLWSLVLGYSDLEFRRGNAADVAVALRIAPGDAGYLAQWSLLTESREESVRSLENAVSYNPYYSWAWIQLGLAAEGDGRNDLAERDLLRAAGVDRGFAPRWALCDFYFRRRNTERFWYWSKQALAIDDAESGPVFRLDWRMDPDARTILDRGIPSTQTARRKFLKYLTEEQSADRVFAVVSDLLPAAERDDVPLLVSYTSKLLEERDVKQALSLWNSLCERRLLPFRAVPPNSANILTNADFSTFPSGNVFDWQFLVSDGITAEKDTTSREFKIRLSGLQPENCRILSQRIAVEPGHRYEFDFHVRVTGAASPAGLRWKILEGSVSGHVLAESPDLAMTDSNDRALTFSSTEPLLTLALDYDRPRGTTRPAAVVAISRLSLRVVAAPGNQ